MLTSIRGYLLAVGVFVLPACSTVSVTTDFDRSASFAQYHSYILDPSLEKIGLSPSSETALRETLRNSLARHGILETTENADLHIVRHISAQEKLMVHQSSAGVPYRYGRYGMWTGAPYYYTDVSQYTEGTLILDFVDAKTQKLVFRGVGTGTVSDPETNADRIKQAVEKIVQGYPSPVSQ
ncbi:DUF4136 domain-containing protein [Methylomonas sp. LL1]|uniref:DUF4136 domain-containing protein n=1 Tax=Methylomonas sp. LL1 TaxID=2785785 RepID=UPI0018C3E8E0|nr:DUF4136 domain-containing protein [Methylomonas sp. LL1]QPK63572.1 DUF4136 domain-containing protein [Methylomonas sp. LL1]